jgi:hypothetical protein
MVDVSFTIKTIRFKSFLLRELGVCECMKGNKEEDKMESSCIKLDLLWI